MTTSPARRRPGISRRTVLGALGASVIVPGILGSNAHAAQAWPDRPVRFLLGFAAGGATDVLSRVYCRKMSDLTGQQFFVENRTGAGGQVAMTALAKAAPDGYTIGMGNIANNAMGSALYRKLPYDQSKDFTFISGLWQLPNLLVVSPSLGVNTVPELIALLKKSPGKYMFASSGPGTTVHIAGELFKSMAKVDIVHVPYRGGKPALVDLMAGHVHMLFDNIPGSLPYARDGSVKALGVTTLNRNASAPDIPAVAEFLPGFEITSWTGVAAPAGLPPAISERLAALTNIALTAPEVAQKFRELGATPWPTTPQELTEYRAKEEIRLTQIIRSAGISLE